MENMNALFQCARKAPSSRLMEQERQMYVESAVMKERVASAFYDEPSLSDLRRALDSPPADEEVPMSRLDERREPPASPRRPPPSLARSSAVSHYSTGRSSGSRSPAHARCANKAI